MKQNLTYRDAGVDIDSGNALIDRIKPLAAATRRDGVLGSLGGFGSLFELPVGKYRQPVLVSGTDGVGTKLRFAIEMNMLDGLGTDLVAMCVNDIAVTGAEALFFLDYYATSSLDVDTAARVVAGIADGCKLAGCALSGGETAEMPGIYQPGDFDIAGFAVGIVEKSAIVDGQSIKAGDQLIGLASSGVHSNGFSLINHILEDSKAGAADHKTPANSLPEGMAERLLQPTRIYTRSTNALVTQINVKGMAHITGGGLLENLPRVLPKGVCASIDTSTWQRAAEFHWIRDNGNVEITEMYRVFNCGIGMVVVVSPEDVQEAIKILQAHGEDARVIGEVEQHANDANSVNSDSRVNFQQLENF